MRTRRAEPRSGEPSRRRTPTAPRGPRLPEPHTAHAEPPTPVAEPRSGKRPANAHEPREHEDAQAPDRVSRIREKKHPGTGVRCRRPPRPDSKGNPDAVHFGPNHNRQQDSPTPRPPIHESAPPASTCVVAAQAPRAQHRPPPNGERRTANGERRTANGERRTATIRTSTKTSCITSAARPLNRSITHHALCLDAALHYSPATLRACRTRRSGRPPCGRRPPRATPAPPRRRSPPPTGSAS
jgi:hypothetical protein